MSFFYLCNRAICYTLIWFASRFRRCSWTIILRWFSKNVFSSLSWFNFSIRRTLCNKNIVVSASWYCDHLQPVVGRTPKKFWKILLERLDCWGDSEKQAIQTMSILIIGYIATDTTLHCFSMVADYLFTLERLVYSSAVCINCSTE